MLQGSSPKTPLGVSRSCHHGINQKFIHSYHSSPQKINHNINIYINTIGSKKNWYHFICIISMNHSSQVWQLCQEPIRPDGDTWEPIDFPQVTSLRLSFKNIIEAGWLLPSYCWLFFWGVNSTLDFLVCICVFLFLFWGDDFSEGI